MKIEGKLRFIKDIALTDMGRIAADLYGPLHVEKYTELNDRKIKITE